MEQVMLNLLTGELEIWTFNKYWKASLYSEGLWYEDITVIGSPERNSRELLGEL